VVEFQPLVPARLSVAIVTGSAKLACVWIFGAVTVDALPAEVLCRQRRRVTDVAVDLRMRTLKLESRLTRMVVRDLVPGVIAVALLAASSETRSVGVVRAVAPHAGHRQLALIVTAAMTGRAGQLCMTPEQREAAVARMIEARTGPGAGVVTARAVIATRASMRIVRGMTPDAGLRCARVPAADVTGIAAQLRMRAGELKVRAGMIEPRARPGIRTVAGSAIRRHLPPMHVVGAMTVAAACRRLAPGLASGMTARAGERTVSAAQGKLREAMIELRRQHADDVSTQPVVLRMACAAFAGTSAWHAPVIAAMRLKIGADILVAGHAQRALPRTIGAVVAGGTAPFQLRMRGREHAGLEQRLDRCRVCPIGGKKRSHSHQQDASQAIPDPSIHSGQ